MREPEQKTVTRRQIVHTGVAAGATVMAPSFVSVASGATESEQVELETVATVPMSTNIEITVYEDSDGDGTADRQQTQTIPDGTETVVYDALTGAEAQGYTYWLEVQLSTTDDSVTPELDSATITLPEAGQTPTATPLPEQEKQSPGEIWDNFLVFVGFITAVVAGIAGLGSRSMAVGVLAAYSVFAYIAVETGHVLLENILYVSLVLVVVGMAMKLWRMEFGGEI